MPGLLGRDHHAVTLIQSPNCDTDTLPGVMLPSVTDGSAYAVDNSVVEKVDVRKWWLSFFRVIFGPDALERVDLITRHVPAARNGTGIG